MTAAIHQPHDKLFKLSMSELRVATEFFQAHLPPTLLEKMDLTTLKLENNSFIDETYKDSEADVIYSVQLKDQNIAYLYTLCEQQSTVDANMAFRLWVYTVRLMELHRRQYPDTPLPLVYPLVVYSGEAPWNAPLEIYPLFGSQEVWAREHLLKPYQLIDLHRLDDQDLRKYLGSGLVEFALKYKNLRDFVSFLETLLPWVRELEETRPAEGLFLGNIVLKYTLNNMNSDGIDIFVDKVNHHLTGKLRGDIMTLAQQFEQRGLERGLQQGEAAMILRLLQHRFGSLPPSYAHRIMTADPETLFVWGEKILEAQTLEEVLAEEEV